jgi:hypothetical protein
MRNSILVMLFFCFNIISYSQCPATPVCTQTATSGTNYTVAAGSVLCISSNYNSGTITISGGTVIIQSGGTLNSGATVSMTTGTIHVASGGTLSKNLTSTSASIVNNCGTIAAASDYNANITLNNYSTVALSLKYGGNKVNNYANNATISFGTVDASDGILNNYATNLKFSITSSWNQGITFNNASGTSMEITAVPGSMPGSTVFNNSGTLTYTPVLSTIGATFNNALGATLNFSSSASANQPNITNNGTLNVAGTFYLAGGTTSNNGTMTFSDELRLDGGTLNLNKNSTATTKTLYKNSGAINMDDHSVLNIQQNITTWNGSAINLVSGCASVIGSATLSNNSINSNLLSSPNLNFCGSAPMQSGGSCLAVPLTVTDNGSGAIRITGVFTCGINNLDYVEINGTLGVPNLNGYWRVNKISSFLGIVTLDLIGSTFVSGSIITLTSIQYDQTKLKLGTATYLGYSSCANPCAPLPIKLVSFTALKESNAVKIEWQTIEEKNNAYYEIQRSVDGITYETMTIIAGHKNSSSLITYADYDYNPLAGTSYYRLKQVDIYGTYSYSSIAAIEMNDQTNWTIYPNPSIGGSFTLTSTFSENEIVAIRVTDITGNQLRYYDSNSYEQELHVRDLTSGMYVVSIQTSTTMLSKKLIVR